MRTFYCSLFLLLLTFTGYSQKKNTQKNQGRGTQKTNEYEYDHKGQGHGRGHETRNIFPHHGNVGIGIHYPTEALEVIGNIKVSQSIFAQELQVVGLQATNFTVSEDATVGKNLLVNGSIGIGVAAPTEKLDIAGNLRVSNTIFSDQLNATTLNATTGTLSGRLSVGENVLINGLTGMGVDEPSERLEVAGNIKASQSLLAIGLQAETGTLVKGLTVGEDVIVNGKVGIGVSVPNATLDVAGDIRALGNLAANSANTENLNTTTATVSNALTVSGTTQTNTLEATEFIVTNQTANTIRTKQFAINTERIPEGFVMAVDGNMLATRVEVFAPENWPDYVFSDNYRLRTLTEVEQYIKKYGHLPNVPSAEKMQQGEYSLSQMDANLLEKIEELTLYMIELKKENEALKSQLEQLNNN